MPTMTVRPAMCEGHLGGSWVNARLIFFFFLSAPAREISREKPIYFHYVISWPEPEENVLVAVEVARSLARSLARTGEREKEREVPSPTLTASGRVLHAVVRAVLSVAPDRATRNLRRAASAARGG